MLSLFRYLAIVLFLFKGAAIVGLGFFALDKIPMEKLKNLDRTELWFSFVLAAALPWAAGWQLLRGKGRGFAWTISITSALIWPGWLRLIGIIPLAYLITELVHNRRQRARQPDADTATGGGGSWPYEITLFVAATVLANMFWRALPAWMHPAIPEDGVRWGIAAWAIAVWISILIHEAGHAAAGAVAGFRVSKFAAFPFEYTQTARNSYFKVNLKMFLGGFYMGFPTRVDNLERRYLFMTACGPLAGILYAVACWFVLWLAHGAIAGLAYGVLRESMSFSLIMSLLNLMPFKTGCVKMDGRILWDAWFDRASTDATIAMLGCSSSMRSPLRPREWPETWVEHLRSGTLDAMSAPLLAYSAEDRLNTAPNDLIALNDLALSTAAIGQVADQLVGHKEAQAAFRFHQAWLRSRYGGVIVDQETILNASSDPETEPYEILRLQAALLAAEGETDAALAKVSEAEAELAASSKSGLDAADLDGLRVFRDDLLAVATVPLPTVSKSHTR